LQILQLSVLRSDFFQSKSFLLALADFDLFSSFDLVFNLQSFLKLCLLQSHGLLMPPLVQLLQLLTDVRRAAFHDLVASLLVIFI